MLQVVRNNAFPVWEELIEVVVRSPEDQVRIVFFIDTSKEYSLGISSFTATTSSSSSYPFFSYLSWLCCRLLRRGLDCGFTGHSAAAE